MLRYLDCGLYENGFARIRCPECREEYLLAFSCKTRELCPSCAAKRSAATAALLAEEVIDGVGAGSGDSDDGGATCTAAGVGVITTVGQDGGL